MALHLGKQHCACRKNSYNELTRRTPSMSFCAEDAIRKTTKGLQSPCTVALQEKTTMRFKATMGLQERKP